MHRHGYKGKKFHRERDQREALIKGLADSLIKYESIETTLVKAKEVSSYVEKLITKAKKGDLHNRRQVIAGLQTLSSAHKLVDEIAPKLGARTSGHLRIEKTTARRGDNTQMARISFVDNLTKPAQAVKTAEVPKSEKTEAKVKPATAKTATKTAATNKPAKKEEAKA